jgi:hypothetical protein
MDAGCPATMPSCLGVCASTPPGCFGGQWVCTGPGYESVETRCDGFDNDCDGTVDEGCATCALDDARAQANLFSKWDVDFDSQCNTYLTTIVSGPDHVSVVPAAVAEPVATYEGNANQNMGFALVDPDPAHRRVVVAYSCCTNCGCQAQNGLTLLYTCDAGTVGCGCAGQANCPGFLEAPFLPSQSEDTGLTSNGNISISTPTGLAAGPGNTYFVGNWRPATCSLDAGCTECDPGHPGITCSPTRTACCDTSALGRLAQFTLPEAGLEPTFRVVAIWPGQAILSITSTASGDVLVGTKTPTGGAVHKHLAASGTASLLASFGTPVYSVAEDRRTGDVYLELLSGAPKLRRLSAAGAPLALPAAVPANPAENGRLEFGPDGKLYRLIGRTNAQSTLDSYPVR